METLIAMIILIGIFLIIRACYMNYMNYLSSPQLSRDSRVIGKRQNVSGSSSQYGGCTSTSYYITFEFRDGSREEFGVAAKDYGLLAEGDRGTLHSKRRHFLGFDRKLPY